MPKPKARMTESKFSPSRKLRILTASALDKLAHSAFMGAAYHLHRIRKLVASPYIQTMWKEDTDIDDTTKNKYQAVLNQFHWHMRAFFWELVASFDTMLQWANQKYGLGVPEVQVNWNSIASKVSKYQTEWAEKKALLKSAWDSEWYYEIRMYRNFSHRSFLLVRSVYNGPTLKLMFLIPAREGQQEYIDLLQQLSQYLDHLRQLGKKVFT